MSEEYLDYILSGLAQKELSERTTSVTKYSLFDSCFEWTEKISRKPKFIKEFKVNDKVIGRKYFNKNNEIKYVEILTNPKFELMGISPNITFIYKYDQKIKNGYDENKFIGFRYYKKSPNKFDPNYFTLVNKYDLKYYILEKNEKLKDINNDSFFNQDLNCFDIIDNIIKQKYKNQNINMNGETFPEIIGYCYGLISLQKFKNNFICIEPLIPDVMKLETFEENIPDKLEEDTTYLEPIICDGHISLVIIFEVKKHRYNIILDMSRYHTNSKNLHKSIFPNSIIIQNFIYPKIPIQNYSSCCLWFYGQIECLLKNENYISFKSIFDRVKGNQITYYIDVINVIGKNFYNMDDLFKAGEQKNTFPEKIDLDRLFINTYKPNYAVHKNIIITQFLDIKNFFSDLAELHLPYYYKLLIDSQNIFGQYIAYINLLEINYKFNKYFEENGDSTTIIDYIVKEKKAMNEHFIEFKKIYDVEFIKNNISSYDRFDLNITDFNLSELIKKKIENNDFENKLKQFNQEIKKSEKRIKEVFNIFSVEEIAKKLNPLNDICFTLMNK